jgi:hypothetical protein
MSDTTDWSFVQGLREVDASINAKSDSGLQAESTFVEWVPENDDPPPRKLPPRLFHKKSRSGCAQCRARRVKVRTMIISLPIWLSYFGGPYIRPQGRILDCLTKSEWKTISLFSITLESLLLTTKHSVTRSIQYVVIVNDTSATAPMTVQRMFTKRIHFRQDWCIGLDQLRILSLALARKSTLMFVKCQKLKPAVVSKSDSFTVTCQRQA